MDFLIGAASMLAFAIIFPEPFMALKTKVLSLFGGKK
jgi:hypothetical protein